MPLYMTGAPLVTLAEVADLSVSFCIYFIVVPSKLSKLETGNEISVLAPSASVTEISLRLVEFVFVSA